jgi:hypothetical protein
VQLLEVYILDTATSVKDSHNELMWATRSIHRHARMCIEAEGSQFEHLL